MTASQSVDGWRGMVLPVVLLAVVFCGLAGYGLGAWNSAAVTAIALAVGAGSMVTAIAFEYGWIFLTSVESEEP